MTRTMYDAINAGSLPADGDLYAGYVDGNWPDKPAVAARFPGKLVVGITVNPNDNIGVVGDGPPDNGAWDEWVNWVLKRRAAGEDPALNTNMSSWPAGKAAFKAAGVAAPHWWIADYDDDPAIPAGAVAKQYASNSLYDTSSVVDYWPGVDTTPVPPAPIQTDLEEIELIIFDAPRSAAPDAPRDMWLFGNGKYQHILDSKSYEAYVKAGLKVAVIEYADHEQNLSLYGASPVA
jgi:hypothetical protein